MQITQINAKAHQDIASAAAERDNLLLLIQRMRHEHEVLEQQFAGKSQLVAELREEISKAQASASDDVQQLQRRLDGVQREVRIVVFNTEIRFVNA